MDDLEERAIDRDEMRAREEAEGNFDLDLPPLDVCADAALELPNLDLPPLDPPRPQTSSLDDASAPSFDDLENSEKLFIRTPPDPSPEPTPAPDVHVKRAAPKPGPIFDTYLRFAAERMAMYWRRLDEPRLQRTHEPYPIWSRDPILASYRFTNVYRACDRVSQFLIRHVSNAQGNAAEIVFRTLLFKVFNKVSTWVAILTELGRYPRLTDVNQIAAILDAMKDRGAALYSAAYVMPSPNNAPVKHRAHLSLVAQIGQAASDVFVLRTKPRTVRTLEQLYRELRSVPGFGPFLGFQYAIDLNYSDVFDFDEDSFVVAGPGARDGIRKCFGRPGDCGFDRGDYSDEDIIRWTRDNAAAGFERLGLEFTPLPTINGGVRWPRLIDWQNVYCELDKYARVAHPNIILASGRTKIKQRYKPDPTPLAAPFFPPKWKIADLVRL